MFTTKITFDAFVEFIKTDFLKKAFDLAGLFEIIYLKQNP